MKPKLSAFAFLVVAACTANRPDDWVKVDHTLADRSVLTAAIADCRAQAVLAAENYGAVRPLIFAQYSPQDYVVVPPPAPGSYQAPQVDFSPLQNSNPRHGFIQRQQLINSLTEGCMAQKGYIRAEK
jgi:hypothetical protein